MSVRAARALRARRVATAACALAAAACGRTRDAAPARDSVAAAPVAPPPVTLDSGATAAVELWTLPPVRPARDEPRRLRRIVEHLHADVALAPGFVDGGLLATGDGRTLMALLRWRDTSAALRARPVIARWFELRADDPAVRKAAGSATPEVRVAARLGAPPVLVADSGVWVVTRYARKEGHSAGALASVVRAELARTAGGDPAVRGAALLVHADSGALVTVVQARAVNGLELPPDPKAPLPAWAPFATREVRPALPVAVIRARGEPAPPPRPAARPAPP